jgi:hypothetical protein
MVTFSARSVQTPIPKEYNKIMKNKNKNTTTPAFFGPTPVYVVANRDGRRFLNRPVYTGQAEGAWSDVLGAHIFSTRRAAAKCAYDINRRSEAREPFAFVVDSTVVTAAFTPANKFRSGR